MWSVLYTCSIEWTFNSFDMRHEKYSCNTMYIELTYDFFDMRNDYLKCNVLCVFFISFSSFNIGYFIQPCKIACSMHFRPLQHTLDLAKLAFSACQFLAGKFP